SAVDGVDDDAFGDGGGGGARVVEGGRPLVGGFVADHVDDLEGLFRLRPVHLGGGAVDGVADEFLAEGGVVGVGHEVFVNRVEVFGELGEAEGLEGVAVSEQADAEDGGGAGLGDFVDDGPDLLLGGFDDGTHGAGAVDAEDDVDVGLVGLGRGVGGAGKGGEQGENEKR